MTRTGLDGEWLDALAFAAIHALIARNKDRYNLIVDRFSIACRDRKLQPIPANADVVDAAARVLQRAVPLGPYALEFHEIGGDGTEVGPSVFETTEAGRAAVWAGRVATAAASGDFDSVSALISVYESTGDALGLGNAMEALFLGAAQIVHEMYPRMALIDAQISVNAGGRMTYSIACHGRIETGETWDQPCYTFPLFTDRMERDQVASEHIADWGHAVKLTEEPS